MSSTKSKQVFSAEPISDAIKNLMALAKEKKTLKAINGLGDLIIIRPTTDKDLISLVKSTKSGNEWFELLRDCSGTGNNLVRLFNFEGNGSLDYQLTYHPYVYNGDWRESEEAMNNNEKLKINFCQRFA